MHGQVISDSPGQVLAQHLFLLALKLCAHSRQGVSLARQHFLGCLCSLQHLQSLIVHALAQTAETISASSRDMLSSYTDAGAVSGCPLQRSAHPGPNRPCPSTDSADNLSIDSGCSYHIQTQELCLGAVCSAQHIQSLVVHALQSHGRTANCTPYVHHAINATALAQGDAEIDMRKLHAQLSLLMG